MKTLQEYVAFDNTKLCQYIKTINESTSNLVYITIDFEKTKMGGVYMFCVDKKNLKQYFDMPQQGDLKAKTEGIKAIADAFNSEVEEITGFKIICAGCLNDDNLPVTEL